MSVGSVTLLVAGLSIELLTLAAVTAEYVRTIRERKLSSKKVHNDNALAEDLHKAIQEGHLLLHYQPQVSLLENKVVGVEALVRWNHPELGMLQPSEFIPVAEGNGSIIELGYWVLQEACRQHKEWGITDLRLSVNLSALQFTQKDLVSRIKGILETETMNPANLMLEITESTSMNDIDFTLDVLNELRETGIHISIDDFGTGYSSLAYLDQLPINELKIDRSFVSALAGNKNGKVIIKSIIDLAKNLGLSVIAEGVETEDQLNFLKESSCDDIQGYLLSPPVSSDSFIATLNRTGFRLG